MLDWLYTVAYGIYGYVSGPVKNFVYSVVHGILGALNAVAGNMWAVWWPWVVAMWSAGNVFTDLCSGIYNILHWLIFDGVLWLQKYANNIFFRLVDLEHYVARVVRGWVDDAIAYAKQLVQDATAWVVQHVWEPLWGYVQDLYDKMTRWAYTAYFYVTHPDALAEVIFWSLWGVFTRNVWSVSRAVGEWTLRMVLANAVPGVRLVEQIVTDVL